MDKSKIEELKYISSEVGKDILRMVGVARFGSYETPLAVANLLVYLYWEELMLSPSEPHREERDLFILGIPEAAPALYATLARRGFFEREHLWHYRRLGAMLQATPDFRRIPGMDAPCLNIQPTLSVAASLAARMLRSSFKPRIFLLVSERAFCFDEFAKEAMRVSYEELPNLLMIALTKDDFAANIEPFRNWEARWAASDDFASLERACASFDFSSGAPKALFVSAFDTEIPLFGDFGGERSLSMGEIDQALEKLEVRSIENR